MIEREWQERTLGPEEKRRKVLRTRGKMTETGQEGKSGESRKEASPRAERGLAQDPSDDLAPDQANHSHRMLI